MPSTASSKRADIGDFGGAGKHQRQRARDFGDRAKVSLADHLGRKSIFDAIGVPDHTDHRPPHCIAFQFSRLANSSGRSCLAAERAGSTCLLRTAGRCYFRLTARFWRASLRHGQRLKPARHPRLIRRRFGERVRCDDRR